MRKTQPRPEPAAILAQQPAFEQFVHTPKRGAGVEPCHGADDLEIERITGDRGDLEQGPCIVGQPRGSGGDEVAENGGGLRRAALATLGPVLYHLLQHERNAFGDPKELFRKRRRGRPLGDEAGDGVLHVVASKSLQREDRRAAGREEVTLPAHQWVRGSDLVRAVCGNEVHRCVLQSARGEQQSVERRFVAVVGVLAGISRSGLSSDSVPIADAIASKTRRGVAPIASAASPNSADRR